MEIQQLQWRWYVLHTRSRFEKVVHEGLFKKSHEVFLPQIRVRSRRRDRRVMLDVPLFPGYVFIRSNLHPDHHLDILKTVGAVRLIGNQNLPVPVPDEAIESLRIMVSRDAGVKTGKRLRRGDRVMVVRGPFTGVVGTFAHYRGIGRVVVHIEALGQYASVEVDEDDIEALPAGDRKTAYLPGTG
ncbi:MAG: UpxY family transcription antiterminator [Desulfobacterales bacterium]|nr:UpxY family transcription antiterminator [Desulfobacterales bacterium]MDJ0853665.1 UpxY family transcription antiterminator [Desulfobacterales bacterium]MDJ0888093.1 UpxY family transcription antiterminator [Desulfobacterales bacterium]